MRPGRLMRQRSRNGPAKSGEHSGRGLGSFRGLCGSADQIGEYFRGWRVFFLKFLERNKGKRHFMMGHFRQFFNGWRIARAVAVGPTL